jgi:hypothetical protein
MLPLLAALATLGACGGTIQRDEMAAPAMTDATCRAQAEASPEARAVFQRVDIGDLYGQRRAQEDRRIAIARAYSECLRQRGVRGAGGVEVIR